MTELELLQGIYDTLRTMLGVLVLTMFLNWTLSLLSIWKKGQGIKK